MTELADGSDNDVNACGYYTLQADIYATIYMGEPEFGPETTPAMHAAMSDPTFMQTGRGREIFDSPISVRTP